MSRLKNNDYDLFLSYRTGHDDDDFVKLLYMRLSTRYRVFYDKECLRCGEDWQEGFVKGLANSHVFIPIITPYTFGGNRAPVPNRQDNVLLEYEIAVELLTQKRGKLKCLYPLLVGNLVDGLYQRPQFPSFESNLFLEANKVKIQQFCPLLDLMYSETLAQRTVKELFDGILSIQCRFFTGSFDDASRLFLDDLTRNVHPPVLDLVPIKPQPSSASKYAEGAQANQAASKEQKKNDCIAILLCCCIAFQMDE